MSDGIVIPPQGEHSDKAVEQALRTLEATPLVKVIPRGIYLARKKNGDIDYQNAYGLEQAEDLLIDRHLLPERDRKNPSPLHRGPNVPSLCIGVHGFDICPDRPPFFFVDGDLYRNIWVRPKLISRPGSFERIKAVIRYLVGGDEKALEYVVNWCARKVRFPGEPVPTTILLMGAGGTGKNLLFEVLRHIIGKENSVAITESTLSKEFNGSYAQKLLVFGNELFADHKRKGGSGSLADQLKDQITDPTIEIERKGVDRVTIRNRAAYIFATNKQRPICLDESDRRWSVFRNFKKPGEYVRPEDGRTHKQFLASLCAEGKTFVFRDDFVEEIAAFAYYLERCEVDHDLVREPYDNQARRDLLKLSQPPTQRFLSEFQAEAPEVSRTAFWAIVDDLASRGDAYGLRQRLLVGSAPGWLTFGGLDQLFRAWGKDHGIPPFQMGTETTLGLELENAGWVWGMKENRVCRLPPWEQALLAQPKPELELTPARAEEIEASEQYGRAS